jgi:hypothetical protein
VTNGVDGFTDLPLDKDYVISFLTAVVAVSGLSAKTSHEHS